MITLFFVTLLIANVIGQVPTIPCTHPDCPNFSRLRQRSRHRPRPLPQTPAFPPSPPSPLPPLPLPPSSPLLSPSPFPAGPIQTSTHPLPTSADACDGVYDYEAVGNTASSQYGDATSGNDVYGTRATSVFLDLCAKNNTASTVIGSGVSGNEVRVGQVGRYSVFGVGNVASNNSAQSSEGSLTTGNRNTIGVPVVSYSDIYFDNVAKKNNGSAKIQGDVVTGNQNQILSQAGFGGSFGNDVYVDNVAFGNQATSGSGDVVSGNNNDLYLGSTSYVSSSSIAGGNFVETGSGNSVSGNRDELNEGNIRGLNNTSGGNVAVSNTEGNAISGNQVQSQGYVFSDATSLLSLENDATSKDGDSVSGNIIRVGTFGAK